MNDVLPQTNSRSKKTFSIATVLGLTAVFAIHLAFPVLLAPLALTILLALVLGLFLLPIGMIAAFRSKRSGNRFRLVENPIFVRVGQIYLVIVGVSYLLSVPLAIFTNVLLDAFQYH